MKKFFILNFFVAAFCFESNASDEIHPVHINTVYLGGGKNSHEVLSLGDQIGTPVSTLPDAIELLDSLQRAEKEQRFIFDGHSREKWTKVDLLPNSYIHNDAANRWDKVDPQKLSTSKPVFSCYKDKNDVLKRRLSDPLNWEMVCAQDEEHAIKKESELSTSEPVFSCYKDKNHVLKRRLRDTLSWEMVCAQDEEHAIKKELDSLSIAANHTMKKFRFQARCSVIPWILDKKVVRDINIIFPKSATNDSVLENIKDIHTQWSLDSLKTYKEKFLYRRYATSSEYYGDNANTVSVSDSNFKFSYVPTTACRVGMLCGLAGLGLWTFFYRK